MTALVSIPLLLIKNPVLLLPAILVCLVIGFICLTRAKNLQRYLVKSIEGGEAFNPFPKYVKSSSYVVVTRIIGACCILVAVFLAAVMIRSL